MKLYLALEGQSILDVCLDTYGTFDLIVKLMNENSFNGVNTKPFTGQEFWYDETLVSDISLQQNIYSTSAQ